MTYSNHFRVSLFLTLLAWLLDLYTLTRLKHENKMSSQKGNVSRSRGQKHQNATAFKNDKHGASVQVKVSVLFLLSCVFIVLCVNSFYFTLFLPTAFITEAANINFPLLCYCQLLLVIMHLCKIFLFVLSVPCIVLWLMLWNLLLLS